MNWQPGKMTFGDAVYRPGMTFRDCNWKRCIYFPPVKAHVISIVQPSKQSGAWKRFIINVSHGITKAGVTRINDSIRTYVYAILGAQGQTTTDIVGESSKSLGAQKQFMTLTETVIESDIDNLPTSIKNYQNKFTIF